jgi:hypothetical protein
MADFEIKLRVHITGIFILSYKHVTANLHSADHL